MNRTLKIGLIAALLVYGLGLAFTYYTNDKIDKQFEQFDIDKNGEINGEEITKDSSLFLFQLESRKTTQQAFIMLIPVALIIGLFVGGIAYLFKKMKTIDANEINYRKKLE